MLSSSNWSKYSKFLHLSFVRLHSKLSLKKRPRKQKMSNMPKQKKKKEWSPLAKHGVISVPMNILHDPCRLAAMRQSNPTFVNLVGNHDPTWISWMNPFNVHLFSLCTAQIISAFSLAAPAVSSPRGGARATVSYGWRDNQSILHCLILETLLLTQLWSHVRKQFRVLRQPAWTVRHREAAAAAAAINWWRIWFTVSRWGVVMPSIDASHTRLLQLFWTVPVSVSSTGICPDLPKHRKFCISRYFSGLNILFHLIFVLISVFTILLIHTFKVNNCIGLLPFLFHRLIRNTCISFHNNCLFFL